MSAADTLTPAERSALAEACDRVAKAMRSGRIEAAGHSAVKIVAAGAIGFLAGLLINEGHAAPEADCCRIHEPPRYETSITKTHDGRAHLAYSAVGAAVITAFSDPYIGFGVMFAAGVAKEVWDSKHPGHDASWADLRADFYGSALGAISAHYVKGLVVSPRSITYQVEF